MNLQPGDTYIGEFTTWIPGTGVAADADSLPTAVVSKNGVDDGAVVVTVTDKGVGRYKLSFTVPNTYAVGDFIAVTALFAVSTVNMSVVVDMFRLDNTTSLLQALINNDTVNTVTYYGYAIDADGTPVRGRTISISLIGGPQSSGSAIIETNYSGIETDRQGRWQANLARGKTFQIRIPEENVSVTVDVPTDTNITTVNIKDELP